MRFVLQVHYCCWEDLLIEVTKDYRTADKELHFFGNSRQHAATCASYRPEPKRSRKRGLAEIAATSPEIES